MIILIDQDGPLADFEGTFLEVWRDKYPDEFFIPVEKRRNLKLIQDYPEEYKDMILNILGSSEFIINLKPTPGAKEAIEEMLALGHDVFICTTPRSAYEHNVMEKYKWVENHLGRDFLRKMILTDDKTLIRGNFLIDDKVRITGARPPEWERIVFDAAYNREVPGKRLTDWSNWREVLEI